MKVPSYLGRWCLALLLPSLVHATPCEYNGSHSVVCKSLNLSAIPKNELGDGVKSLEIAFNHLDVLEDNCFDDYPSLTILYLYSNEIRVIEEDAFEDLDELHHLDLSHNKLSTLDPDSFQENSKLISLSLKDNPLILSQTPIISSDSVSTLDLSKCNLTTLYHQNFADLPKLQTLNLRHNSLQELPADFFDHLPQLKHVYLHGNPWRCDDFTKSLMASKQHLIVDYKKIQCVESSSEQPEEVDRSEPVFEPRDPKSNNPSADSPEYDEVVSDEEKEDDVEVVEVSHDIRTAMLYINLVLVVTVSGLLVSIVTVILKQFGIISCRRKTSLPEEDVDRDGYLSPITKTGRNFHVEHVYERIH